MKKIEIKIGETYACGNFIFNHVNSDPYLCNNYAVTKTKYYKEDAHIKHYNNHPQRLATPEEKHWLETCIKANKYISYEEAMKTFVKYYKIIENKISMNYNNNVIHKKYTLFGHFDDENNRIIKTIETGKHCNDSSINVLYGKIGEKEVCFDMIALESSTKEAYDAQFVVKEPEFVLPEKWYVKPKTKENLKTMLPWLKNVRPSTDYTKYTITYLNNSYDFEGYYDTEGENFINKGYTEITFDQFKKYVLKEQLEIIEEPKDKVLEKEGIDLNIGKIIRVESSEGAIFELGDKVNVFTKDSPNKGKVFTIKGFRWNNAKTNICAITELHSKNGIGLDKIELYSEPKQIVDDFKLPETWWITIENERQLEIAKQYFSQHFNNLNIFRVGKTVGYVKNVLDNYSANAFNLLTSTKMTNPQITFEQFEQHVLHNGFKIGNRFNKVKSLLNHTAPYSINEREIIDLQYINGQSVAFYKVIETSYSGPQCKILTKNIVR